MWRRALVCVGQEGWIAVLGLPLAGLRGTIAKRRLSGGQPSMERQQVPQVDSAQPHGHVPRLLDMLASPPDWLRVTTLERWPSG